MRASYRNGEVSDKNYFQRNITAKAITLSGLQSSRNRGQSRQLAKQSSQTVKQYAAHPLLANETAKEYDHTPLEFYETPLQFHKTPLQFTLLPLAIAKCGD